MNNKKCLNIVRSSCLKFSGWHVLGVIWSQFFLPFSNLLIACLIIRVLSPDDANILFLLLSFALVASVFSDFGLRNAIYTDVALREGEALKGYIRHVYLLRAFLGVLVFCVLVFVAPWLHINNIGTALLFSAFAANMYVADPGLKILCGKSLSYFEIPLSILDRGIVICGLWFMYVYSINVLNLVLSLFVVAGLVRAVSGVVVVSKAILKEKPVIATVLREQGETQRNFGWNHLWAGLALLVTLLNLRFPVLILPIIQLTDHAAHVGIILAVCQSFLLIPSIIAKILFPSVLGQSSAPKCEHLFTSRVIYGSLVVCLVSGILVVLILYPLTVPLLRYLHPEYVQTPGFLQLALFGIPLLCSTQMMRLLATSGGIARSVFFPTLTGSIAAYIIVMGLSPDYGLTRVFYGYFIAESIILALVLIVISRHTSHR